MSKIGMMTPSATSTSYGSYGVFYIDSLDNLGKAKMENLWDADNVAMGSVAYDKQQNVAVYDGEHWIKDDGSEIKNYVMIQSTVISQATETSVDLDDEYGTPYFGLILTGIDVQGVEDMPLEMDVILDGTSYLVERIESGGEYWYGASWGDEEIDFSVYPFQIYSNGDTEWVCVLNEHEATEHTISAYTNEWEEES